MGQDGGIIVNAEGILRLDRGQEDDTLSWAVFAMDYLHLKPNLVKC